MRVTIIGGHGKIALLAAPLLVAAGHQVRSVIRNPAHVAEVAATGAVPVVADVESMDAEALTALLAGEDAVVWSAGAGGGDPARTRAVDRDAAIRSMVAAEAAGSRRYVMVSYFGAGPDHGVPAESDFRAYADAKTEADAVLESSTLDWVLLRPSRLTDDPPSRAIEVRQLDASIEKGVIARADVAELIAGVLQRPQLTRVVIETNRGPVPVDVALNALV